MENPCPASGGSDTWCRPKQATSNHAALGIDEKVVRHIGVGLRIFAVRFKTSSGLARSRVRVLSSTAATCLRSRYAATIARFAPSESIRGSLPPLLA